MSIDTGSHYVLMLDALRDISLCLKYIADPCFEHIDNNHTGLAKNQIIEIKHINGLIANLITDIRNVFETSDFTKIEKISKAHIEALDYIADIKKKQVVRLHNTKTTVRNSLLYLDILAETRSLILLLMNVVKSQRDFIISYEKQ